MDFKHQFLVVALVAVLQASNLGCTVAVSAKLGRRLAPKLSNIKHGHNIRLLRLEKVQNAAPVALPEEQPEGSRRTGPSRRLQQFFSSVGFGPQVGFPYFLDIVLDTFDNVGYAGIIRPVNPAVDRSIAASHLCATIPTARANLATCSNVPGLNALTGQQRV